MPSFSILLSLALTFSVSTLAVGGAVDTSSDAPISEAAVMAAVQSTASDMIANETPESYVCIGPVCGSCSLWGPPWGVDCRVGGYWIFCGTGGGSLSCTKGGP